MRALILTLIAINVFTLQASDEDGKHVTNFICEHIDKVEDVELLMENDQVFLRWKEPLYIGECTLRYALNMYNNVRDEVYSVETINRTLKINFNFIGCTVYRLTIEPFAGNVTGASSNLSLAFGRDVIPPSCEPISVSATSAVLNCAINNDENNLCKISDFDIICRWFDDKRKSKNRTVIMTDVNVTQVDVYDLMEFTNYTCRTAIKHRLGEQFTFRTEEGVPGPPFIHSVMHVTNTSFTIGWNSPTYVPGVLTSYNVTVNRVRPIYFVPNYCVKLKKGKNYGGVVDASQSKYTITDLLPCYEYEVFLKAKTIDYGAASNTKVIQTLGGIPEEPTDVNFNIVDFRLFVNWSFPCTANGIVISFRTIRIGVPLVDNHVGEKRETINYRAEHDKVNYYISFENLEPAFNYTVLLYSVTEDNLESNPVTLEFKSSESGAQAPIIEKIVNVTDTSFTIHWLEPFRKNGILLGYHIYLLRQRLRDDALNDCDLNLNLSNHEIVSSNQTSFTFDNALPGLNYTVILYAYSGGKNGSNVTFFVRTSDTAPDEIRNVKFAFINKYQEYYSGNISVTFKPPCNFNGQFQHISLILNGTRSNRKKHWFMQNTSALLPEYNYSIEIWPQYQYQLIIRVVTEHFVTSTVKNFLSSTGVPLLTNYHMQGPIAISSSQASLNFSKYLFDDTYGDILYYGIIIGQSPYQEKSLYGYWEGNEETWPVVTAEADGQGFKPHLLTPKFWNPFKDTNDSEFTFIIQEKSLQPNVWYAVKVRGFTKHGYRDSSELIFKLPEDYDLSALIFGIIFGILGTVILLGTVFIVWRRRKKWSKKKGSIKSISLNPIPVSVKGFPQYYTELSSDAEKLKQEYTLLLSKSNEIQFPCSEGLVSLNKKKNRYTNVIAYDHSRVKLQELSEDGSDYINASYIKGYSGNVEYIATQGPLQDTAMDFWKMVVQENSTVIVMVAQFVEQNKDKCFKYFPNNHENMDLENGIAIRCCTELDFKTYTVRTLLVQRNLEQWTVTHLQFTDWPDFGCPNGTQMMLEFCRLMRDYSDKSDNPIILHCSAGIGRTGTLIALDILLQIISEDKVVDVFNTVLELRRDRKNMVQTEKQYLYIHHCISDAIQQPAPIKSELTEVEPIYENLEEIKKEQNGVDFKESKF